MQQVTRKAHSFPISIIQLFHDFASRGLQVTLAGGAVRDVLLGKGAAIKDWDFLVLGTAWVNNPDVDRIPNEIPDPGTFKSVLSERYSTNLRCGDVWEFNYLGEQVNVIFPNLTNEHGDGPWETPQDALDKFDTSLNVAYYDFYTSEIVIDPRHSVITGKVEFVSPAASIGYERVLKRYDRLKPKYPDLDWKEIHDWLYPKYGSLKAILNHP